VTDARNAPAAKLLQTLGFTENLTARTRDPFKGGWCTLHTFRLTPPTTCR